PYGGFIAPESSSSCPSCFNHSAPDSIRDEPPMPELPEVETTRRGLEPHLVGRRVVDLVVRQPNLRWPVPRELVAGLRGRKIEGIERRAKYLLVHVESGSALLHLGMSGSLRV